MTIISFKHRFIFFKPLKVAGTSLGMALSRFCGKDDIVCQFVGIAGDPLRPLYYPYPTRCSLDVVINGEKRVAHIKPQMPPHRVWKAIGDDIFFSFLKISVIRNPYDRMVSAYCWFNRNDSVSPGFSVSRFREWFIQNRTISIGSKRKALKRSYDDMDFLIRFEHFEEDLTDLSQRLRLTENIYDTFKEIREKGAMRPKILTTRACFEGFPEGIEKVKKNFAIELERFGYDLPWLSGGLSGGLSADR